MRNLINDDIPVHGVLCFIEADWPVVGGAFATRGVQVLWPKKLYRALRATGSIESPLEAEAHTPDLGWRSARRLTERGLLRPNVAAACTLFAAK